MIDPYNQWKTGVLMHNSSLDKSKIYQLKYFDALNFSWEQKVTNGLGYSPIETEHNNTQYALRKHLTKMEFKVKERDNNFDHLVIKELLVQLWSFDDIFRYTIYHLDKIEKKVTSIKSPSPKQ